MNINDTCIKCEIIFNNEIDFKKAESPNKHLEPLVLNYKDTLICLKCLKELYQEKLISEKRWQESKFHKSK